MEYLKEESADITKILFTGLDTAGKTSIILALKREFSKVANLEPTRGAQRRIFEYLGRDISEWDLGGQDSYKISYLKSPSKYFDNTEIAIYVIDIQDKDRISESLSYLNDVIEQFNILEIKPPIYIFFHKFDPAINVRTQSDLESLILELENKIKNETNYNKFFFYNTSIYNLSSIITPMSEIFLSFYPKANLIQKTVEDFASRFHAEGVEIIDDNSLIIGSYYKDEIIKDILNQSTPYFLSLNDSFQYTEIAAQDEEGKMVIERFGKYFLFTQFRFKEDTPPYYLLCIKQKSKFSREDYLTFLSLLKEILYK